MWRCAVHLAARCAEAAAAGCAICSPAARVEDSCYTEDGLRQPQQGLDKHTVLWLHQNKLLLSFFLSLTSSSYRSLDFSRKILNLWKAWDLPSPFYSTVFKWVIMFIHTFLIMQHIYGRREVLVPLRISCCYFCCSVLMRTTWPSAVRLLLQDNSWWAVRIWAYSLKVYVLLFYMCYISIPVVIPQIVPPPLSVFFYLW